MVKKIFSVILFSTVSGNLLASATGGNGTRGFEGRKIYFSAAEKSKCSLYDVFFRKIMQDGELSRKLCNWNDVYLKDVSGVNSKGRLQLHSTTYLKAIEKDRYFFAKVLGVFFALGLVPALIFNWWLVKAEEEFRKIYDEAMGEKTFRINGRIGLLSCMLRKRGEGFLKIRGELDSFFSNGNVEKALDRIKLFMQEAEFHSGPCKFMDNYSCFKEVGEAICFVRERESRPVFFVLGRKKFDELIDSLREKGSTLSTKLGEVSELHDKFSILNNDIQHYVARTM